MVLTIRTAGPEDLSCLRSVYRRSSLSNGGDREALLQHPEHLVLSSDAVMAGHTRGAELADKGIVGFATVERRSTVAELVDLFVDPESMRRGVARALVDDAVSELANDGIGILEVTANSHALPFYFAMGFEALEIATTPLGSGFRRRLEFGVASALRD